MQGNTSPLVSLFKQALQAHKRSPAVAGKGWHGQGKCQAGQPQLRSLRKVRFRYHGHCFAQRLQRQHAKYCRLPMRSRKQVLLPPKTARRQHAVHQATEAEVIATFEHAKTLERFENRTRGGCCFDGQVELQPAGV